MWCCSFCLSAYSIPIWLSQLFLQTVKNQFLWLFVFSKNSKSNILKCFDHMKKYSMVFVKSKHPFYLKFPLLSWESILYLGFLLFPNSNKLHFTKTQPILINPHSSILTKMKVWNKIDSALFYFLLFIFSSKSHEFILSIGSRWHVPLI